jgi:hypothetical protein
MAGVRTVQQMTQGQSVHKSAKVCNVHRNTAFRWRYRFRTRPDQQKATNLVGIAEADETFFLKSFKGKKQAGYVRPASGAAKRRKEVCPTNKCRDRTGNTTNFVLEKADTVSIYAAFKPVLSSDSILCTNSGKARVAAARAMGITHHRINLAAGIRVIKAGLVCLDRFSTEVSGFLLR